MKFEDLQLSPLLLKSLAKKGYVEPSPIQEKAIPHVLEGRDVLGCAQTGTGKTAAFALPIIQNLMKDTSVNPRKKKIRSLILTPTRELALQIAENFDEYSALTNITATVIFGGVSAVPQIEILRRGVDILVATPGRLLDLINQQEVNLSFLEIFVLDEADRMLDMGFIHDVKKVIALLPKKRQTLLFSATMPKEIQELTKKILIHPVTVEVTPVSSTVDSIDASLYYVDQANKRQLLVYLLKHENISSALVFTRTKHGADRVAKYLTKEKINAAAIHGDKSQNARQTALANFKSGQIRVLVATDIAARGIDIEKLPCVINFDLPNVPEDYVHRIGRTARAGCDGRAISFANIEEKEYVKSIEKLTRKTIPVAEDHPFPMTVFTIEPKETKQRPARKPERRVEQKTTRKAEQKPEQKTTQRTGRTSEPKTLQAERKPIQSKRQGRPQRQSRPAAR